MVLQGFVWTMALLVALVFCIDKKIKTIVVMPSNASPQPSPHGEGVRFVYVSDSERSEEILLIIKTTSFRSIAKKSYYYKNNVISQRSEEILTFWKQKISHFASLRCQ